MKHKKILLLLKLINEKKDLVSLNKIGLSYYDIAKLISNAKEKDLITKNSEGFFIITTKGEKLI